jgi:hypothetical protein
MVVTPEEEQARLANGGAQVVVSSVLTGMNLSFSTTSDSSGRNWSMSLKQSVEGPEVPVVLGVYAGFFAVGAAISYGDLDPSELWWKVSGHIPFVRMVREPSRLALVAEMPIDRNPPHLLPDTIQGALSAVLSAVTLLVKEYPDHVRPELPVDAPARPAGGEGGAPPQ